MPGLSGKAGEHGGQWACREEDFSEKLDLCFMKRLSGLRVAEWWGLEHCVLNRLFSGGGVHLDRILSHGPRVQTTSVEHVLGPSEHQNMCS